MYLHLFPMKFLRSLGAIASFAILHADATSKPRGYDKSRSGRREPDISPPPIEPIRPPASGKFKGSSKFNLKESSSKFSLPYKPNYEPGCFSWLFELPVKTVSRLIMKNLTQQDRDEEGLDSLDPYDPIIGAFIKSRDPSRQYDDKVLVNLKKSELDGNFRIASSFNGIKEIIENYRDVVRRLK